MGANEKQAIEVLEQLISKMKSNKIEVQMFQHNGFKDEKSLIKGIRPAKPEVVFQYKDTGY